MKIIEINEVNTGLYGDGDFRRAFDNVVREIQNFVPLSTSYGNLSFKGNGALAIAKAKSLENAAHSLTEVLKALTIGRR